MNFKISWPVLLRILISVGILFVIVTHLQSSKLISALHGISLPMLLLGIVFYLLCQLISSYRWLELANAMKIEGHLWQFFRFYLLGMFFSLFLPTAVGGDLGRATLLSKSAQCPWMKSFFSILAERFTGLSGMLVLMIVGYLICWPPGGTFVSLTLLTLMTLAVTVVSFGFRQIEHHPWGHRFLERFWKKKGQASKPEEDVATFWPPKKAIFIAIVVSLVFHFFSILIQAGILRQLGFTLPLMLVAIIYGLSSLASLLPSFSGIGVREGSASALLIYWGHLPYEKAVLFSLVWLAILFISALIGGLVLLKDQVGQVFSN